jgi:hypothetical protein
MDTLSDAILQCTKELKLDSACFPLGYGSRFFDTIPEGSFIRSLVADSVVWTSSNYELTHLDQGLHHPDFIMAMYKAAVSKFIFPGSAMTPLGSRQTGCEYHSHGD